MSSLKKIKMEKITSRNAKGTLRNRNVSKTTVFRSISNYVFIVG